MSTACSYGTLVHIFLGMTPLLDTYSFSFPLLNSMFLFSFFLDRKFESFYHYSFATILVKVMSDSWYGIGSPISVSQYGF